MVLYIDVLYIGKYKVLTKVPLKGYYLFLGITGRKKKDQIWEIIFKYFYYDFFPAQTDLMLHS